MRERWRPGNRCFFWSAVTCYRFSKPRLVAVQKNRGAAANRR
jgi:hypothetical protein